VTGYPITYAVNGRQYVAVSTAGSLGAGTQFRRQGVQPARYVPGMDAQRFDIDRSAGLIPAGADIVLEVHYTTNGVESEDQTKVGLELAPGPPDRLFMSVAAAQPGLSIAPGDPNAEATATLKFGQPVDLVYMQPHMHLRGKDARSKRSTRTAAGKPSCAYRATTSTGRSSTIRKHRCGCRRGRSCS
jgi:hypothetical protein